MTEGVAEALSAFEPFGSPQTGFADNPFRLACRLDAPATDAEIARYWPVQAVPAEVIQMWRARRSARLFVDVDYGQWGLQLLAPEDAARRTSGEIATRPNEYRPGDIVIGEFLGDQELLVYAAGARDARVMIALPLDARHDWYIAAHSLAEFLRRYLSEQGEKYWERSDLE